jgi:hypothetical protein
VKSLPLIAAALLLASAAHGATLKDEADSSRDCPQLTNGNACTWTETAATDSAAFYCADSCTCDNTGANDFTLYKATESGTKLNEWWGPVLGSGSASAGSCSPDAAPDTCGTAEFGVGWYILDPDAADGASAECRSKKK